MFGLLDYLKIGAGAVFGAFLSWAVTFPIAYHRGKAEGYEYAQSENRQATFEQAKERKDNDAKVDDMPDADLCKLLGGKLLNDGRCD